LILSIFFDLAHNSFFLKDFACLIESIPLMTPLAPAA
jgi:hypothetical protein